MSMKSFYKKIGKKVKKLREERHLTQELLAEKAGLSLDYIGKIEVNINNPGLKTIFKLAKAMEVEPWELLKFDDDV